MSTPAKKLAANKAIKALLEKIASRPITAEDAARLNLQLGVFGEKYLLKKSSDGSYEHAKAAELSSACEQIVKKEYADRFMLMQKGKEET